MTRKEQRARRAQKSALRYSPHINKTLTRDGFNCVDCGQASNLVVHHKDNSRKTEKMNNSLSNLVTLCRPCHASRHGFLSNHEDVLNMRNLGATLQEIGNKIGVSRQRIYQIVSRQTPPLTRCVTGVIIDL